MKYISIIIIILILTGTVLLSYLQISKNNTDLNNNSSKFQTFDPKIVESPALLGSPSPENIPLQPPATNKKSSSDEPSLMPTPAPQQSQTPVVTQSPTPQNTPKKISTYSYRLHKNITSTVFWVGEPVGEGSSEENALSAWDDEWQKNFGGYDDPYRRNGYYPDGFIPKENPFYLDLPYNDFTDEGVRKNNAYDVVPWAGEKQWGRRESMMKNRWVQIIHNNNVCYGQIQDAGPYEYNDYEYVFGDERPKNTLANNAGMDVSPALRDCLNFEGLNNDENKVDWRFVEFSNVPPGPWKNIITTSQVNWH